MMELADYNCCHRPFHHHWEYKEVPVDCNRNITVLSLQVNLRLMVGNRDTELFDCMKQVVAMLALSGNDCR